MSVDQCSKQGSLTFNKAASWNHHHQQPTQLSFIYYFWEDLKEEDIQSARQPELGGLQRRLRVNISID